MEPTHEPAGWKKLVRLVISLTHGPLIYLLLNEKEDAKMVDRSSKEGDFRSDCLDAMHPSLCALNVIGSV